jgi:hypothetical protein
MKRKDTSMTMHKNPDHKLVERILLNRPRDGDRLMLSDVVLLAALDGSQPLSPQQRNALQQSPLTLRRFRHLALQARAVRTTVSISPVSPIVPTVPIVLATPASAANDAYWDGSSGMLRAADSGAALTTLPTDDRHWVLHFIPDNDGWQVVIALDGAAPFAAHLLQDNVLLEVIDGVGGVILQGYLDGDGECEARWPFDLAPNEHFQQCGAVFSVQPAV